MTREIKFRAWEKDTKTMWDVRELDFACGEAYVGGCYKSLKNLVLVQYTGLKDKNGKEIYEGDIIDTKHFRQVVKYRENQGVFALFAETGYKDGWTVGLSYVKENQCPVIGNIYKNPELLK